MEWVIVILSIIVVSLGIWLIIVKDDNKLYSELYSMTVKSNDEADARDMKHLDELSNLAEYVSNLNKVVVLLTEQQAKLVTSINKVVLKEAAKGKTKKNENLMIPMKELGVVKRKRGSDIDNFIKVNNKIRDKRVDKVSSEGKDYFDAMKTNDKWPIECVLDQAKDKPTAPQSSTASPKSPTSPFNYIVETIKLW